MKHGERNFDDFMDNREKRIAFAFMAIEYKKRRSVKPGLTKIQNKFLFFILLLILISILFVNLS